MDKLSWAELQKQITELSCRMVFNLWKGEQSLIFSLSILQRIRANEQSEPQDKWSGLDIGPLSAIKIACIETQQKEYFGVRVLDT